MGNADFSSMDDLDAGQSLHVKLSSFVQENIGGLKRLVGVKFWNVPNKPLFMKRLYIKN